MCNLRLSYCFNIQLFCPAFVARAADRGRPNGSALRTGHGHGTPLYTRMHPSTNAEMVCIRLNTPTSPSAPRFCPRTSPYLVFKQRECHGYEVSQALAGGTREGGARKQEYCGQRERGGTFFCLFLYFFSTAAWREFQGHKNIVVSANAAGRFSVYFCIFLAPLRGANSKEGMIVVSANAAGRFSVYFCICF